jgi:hypothetical protein
VDQTRPRTVPRTFGLQRTADPSGVSGTGLVAGGVQFPDGTVCLRGRTNTPSTAVYATLGDLMAVHGHAGATEVVWEG